MNDLKAVIQKLRNSILGGAEFPQEHEPFVRKHLPDIAGHARYIPRPKGGLPPSPMDGDLIRYL